MTKSYLPIGSEVIARHDFRSDSAEHLSFFKGDILTIVESSTEIGWYLARNNHDRQGLIPANHVQIRTEVKLNTMPWFHGKITRDEAEKLLQPHKDGLFLVRESTNFPGDYTLCVSCSGKIEHYRTKFEDNKFTIDEEGYFSSLNQLVDHYREDADGLCTALKVSVPKKNTKSDLLVFENAGYSIKTQDLVFLDESLGKGETGDVELAEYGNQKVAVKMMKTSDDFMRSFMTEASLMTCLRHENIIRFLGITFDGPNICLVTEYMEKGSLSEYLRSRGRQIVTPRDQIKFAIDTCAGMAYLESKKIVHRDLAARNVLLSATCTAKVSDFGLASQERFKDICLVSGSSCRVPIKWTAPEALRSGEFSSKSDMWSFGILLYEIYSFGRLPYPKFPLTEVVKYVENGYRMDPPQDCPSNIYAIMRRAWDADPSKRPSFAEISMELDNIEQIESTKNTNQ